MIKTKLMWATAAIMAAACCLPVRAEDHQSEQTETLLFVGYPDGAEWLTTRTLRRIGDAYEEARPGVRIRLEPRLSYWQARTKVLEGEAVGMMISEEGNRYRAYASQTGGSRGFNELKLDRFIPVAVRVIRSRDKVLARMRLGIATDEIPKELRRFLDFLKTDAAKQALAAMPDMKIAVPARKPTRDARGLKRGGEVTLETPILSY